FPCPSVEVGHRTDQPGPIGVLEVEQHVQVPVEVVRQVGQLVPEGLLGVVHHRSVDGTSSIAARRGRDGASPASGSPSNEVPPVGASARGGAEDADLSEAISDAMSSSLPKFTTP